MALGCWGAGGWRPGSGIILGRWGGRGPREPSRAVLRADRIGVGLGGAGDGIQGAVRDDDGALLDRFDRFARWGPWGERAHGGHGRVVSHPERDTAAHRMTDQVDRHPRPL